MKSIIEIKMLIRLLGISSIITGIYLAIDSTFQLAELSKIIEAKMGASEAPHHYGSFDYTGFHSSYLEILWKPLFCLFIGYLAFSATDLIIKAISNKDELQIVKETADKSKQV